MICPHCYIGIRFEISGSSIVYTLEHPVHKQYGFDIAHGFCPECKELIVVRRFGQYWQQGYNDDVSRELSHEREEIIFPPVKRSKAVDSSVPARYKSDFLESYAVLDVSPKASAAISRRLLQDILENHFNLKASNLASEIDLFLKLSGIPSCLAGQVDAVRIIGNFAAHPLKNTNTGEVIDVEPGEAEWLLETLETLFDYAFVQPKRMEKQRNKLNSKLNAAGKPPMK
jgi:hypothetical protein